MMGKKCTKIHIAPFFWSLNLLFSDALVPVAVYYFWNRAFTTSACRAKLFCFNSWVDVSCFSPCVINLSRNKNIRCELMSVVAESIVRVYFE